jgi:hypothetical protein
MDKQLTSTGAKAHQRSDSEWHSQPYSDWHRTLPRWLWMTDVDFIEPAGSALLAQVLPPMIKP